MSLLSIVAVAGAIATVAFTVIPFGKPTSSGTAAGRNDPPVKWRSEAVVMLAAINPMVIASDLWRGWESFGGAIIRLLGLATVLASFWTAGFLLWIAVKGGV